MSFLVNIKPTTPVVTNRDKNRKYMYRYFVSKANQINTMVYEVNLREYEKHMGNQYIVNTYLKWLIVGKKEDTIIEVYMTNPNEKEPITIPGVLTQNKASVMFYSRKIPALKSYLRKYDQFYVGE